ncbi:hypothetical protein T02_2785 [Trichinella nativa]|uniref:Uncharacterized protein n=1 Tax=Trichinella nativa TaxID=6335 RepID=A0A0V1KS12_9BILA|nr:hypothetical protein T02_2785 [Trichinella nativa]
MPQYMELNLDGEERQAAIDDWALCRQNYRVRKSRARARMIEARREGPIGSCSVSAGMPAVRSSNGRLPEITLPKFTGKVLEFPSFWAQFEANVHKRRDLDNATKFTYLLSNTEGTARNAIEGIPLTPENYSQAVDILKKRFGRPRQVIREHLAALWREPACREMTTQGIQALVDDVTKHLRCLTALDRDPFAGRLPVSEALMPMLRDKFPPALIRAWDTNIGPEATDEEDNLRKFLEFAQWQAGLLSTSMGEETKPSASRQEERTPLSKPLRPERRSVDRIRSTAAALAVVAAKGCPFCSGGHKAEACEKRTCLGGETWREQRKSASDVWRPVTWRKGAVNVGPVAWMDAASGIIDYFTRHRRQSRLGRRGQVEPARVSWLPEAFLGGCLQTVRARAYGPDGNHVLVNRLFDTGTEVCFIRKDVADVLRLTGPHERCRFTTLGGRLGAAEGSSRRGACTRMQKLVIPRVCGEVPTAPTESLDGAPARTVAEVELRQREQRAPLVVDVMFGIDYYYEFMTGRIRRATGGSVAVETRLGWITCERAVRNRTPEAGGLRSDDDDLRRFWEIEVLGIAPAEDAAADGTAAMKALEEELRLDGGRYSVSLPWVHGGPALPNNYSHARRRLLALERRLRAHEEDRQQYDSVMKQLGLTCAGGKSAGEDVVPAPPRGLPGGGQRAKMSSAATYKGTTLNRQLEVGPNLQIDLLRAIISFRRLRVGLQADIEKMYLQIRVRADDRDAC